MKPIELTDDEIKLLLSSIEEYKFNIENRYFNLQHMLADPVVIELYALETKLTERLNHGS